MTSTPSPSTFAAVSPLGRRRFLKLCTGASALGLAACGQELGKGQAAFAQESWWSRSLETDGGMHDGGSPDGGADEAESPDGGPPQEDAGALGDPDGGDPLAHDAGADDAGGHDAGILEEDAGAEGEPTETVTLYDTFAIALYFDGGLGPKTGEIYVDYVLDNVPVELEFWHGHGGQEHRFTLLPFHFAALKRRERVYIQTTEVAGHSHRLFIDPVDPAHRMPGALPVEVPV